MKKVSILLILFLVLILGVFLSGCSSTVVKYQCADGSFVDSANSCPAVNCQIDCPKLDCFICSSNYYNCDNFTTHNEAQAVYEACGGSETDIHHLDMDGDGIACESLI